MAAVAAGALIVGTGIQVYGALKSASDQANLDNERALVAHQQADEIKAREAANEDLRQQQAYRQKLQFGASYAASGKAGTGVGSQLQIQNQADLQSMMSNREAQFQEQMLQQQAGIDTTLASETSDAGTLNAIGYGIGGLGKAVGVSTAGGANPGYGGPQSLGAYPSLGVNTNLGYGGAGRMGGG